MTDKELIKQLKTLKEIKPTESEAISARENLVNHIDGSIAEHGYSGSLTQSKNPFNGLVLHFSRIGIWATAGTFAILLGVASGVMMSQDSIPGSTLYPVKIASEDVHKFVARDKTNIEANYAAERLNETVKLAETRLSEDDAKTVAEKVAAYNDNIEEARSSENQEDLETATREAEENSQALTSLISETNETVTLQETLRTKTEERAIACTDKNLAGEISELLEDGSLSALIDAHLISIKCEKVDNITETTEENNSDNLEEPTTEEGENTEAGETVER